jgi:uncharacterized protein YycO
MLAIVILNIPAKPGTAHREIWNHGDIICLNGTSVRSKIVRLLQGYSSDYSHVGLIVIDNGVPFIVNADPAKGKVVKQRWDAVIAPGEISGGAVFRVHEADVSAINSACSMAQQWATQGVPFDNDFNLKNGDRLFCTELVWQAYKSANIDLCKDAESEHPHLLPADLLKSSRFGLVDRF